MSIVAILVEGHHHNHHHHHHLKLQMYHKLCECLFLFLFFSIDGFIGVTTLPNSDDLYLDGTVNLLPKRPVNNRNCLRLNRDLSEHILDYESDCNTKREVLCQTKSNSSEYI